MKNSKISQFISCATIFAVMTTFSTACGEKKSVEREVQTADQLVSNSYASEEIAVSEDVKSVDNLFYSEADDVYYCNAYVTNDYVNKLYAVSSDFSQFTPINVAEQENAEIYITDITPLSDGGVGVFLSVTSYGDLPPIDFKDPGIDWETFDFTPYEEAMENIVTYNIFDKDGNKTFSVDISDVLDENEYISSYFGFSDGSSLAVSEENGIYILDKNGKKTDTIQLEDINWINGIGTDSDNNIILAGYSNKGGYVFNILDMENKAVGETLECSENVFGSGIIKGYGDYSFLFTTDTSLMGYNKNTKEFEETVNWVDSDISNVSMAVVGKDDEFIVVESDYNSDNLCFMRLSERTKEELSKQQVITVGMMYSDTEILDKITEYNKKNTDYRIKNVDYSQYDTEENEYMGGTQKLNEDLISGNAPDIIVSSGNVNMESLAQKSVFVDLYEFIDKDEELSRESFVQNVLTVSEYDGKLYSLGSAFGFYSMVGKTEFVGEKENWNMDELISAYENRPDGMKFMMDSYKQYMFYNCFNSNLNSYIDYKNKTFNCDKAELVKILEFVNQFEDEPDWEDEDAMALIEKEWEDYATAMLDNKYLVQETGIYDFRSFHELLAGTFGGEDVTFVGYPTENGSGNYFIWNSGAFSIVSNSACKEEAWNFIREFFLEEYQNPSEDGNNRLWGLPVNQNAFDNLAEQSKSPYFWIDPETSEKIEYDTTFWAGDKEIPIGDITDEEIARLKDIINNVKRPMNYYDTELYKICEEETGAFFNGDKTAEETADIIINRISIYIAEKG